MHCITIIGSINNNNLFVNRIFMNSGSNPMNVDAAYDYS